MNYGYIRVSSDKQTVENQRFEITHYCEHNHIQIDKWIEETISGTKTPDKRKLGILLHGVHEGDMIICSELSRLGQNLFMIMDILAICMEKGVTVQTIKDNFCLKDDIQTKVLAFAFGLSAEIERNLISQRTNSKEHSRVCPHTYEFELSNINNLGENRTISKSSDTKIFICYI